MDERDIDTEAGPGTVLAGVSRKLGTDAALQRGAWIVLSALLALVAAGLFGRGGPLGEVRAASGGERLGLVYQRFIRYHSPDELDASLRARGNTTTLLLDASYARAIDLERITPEPARSVSADGVLHLEFHTTPGTQLHVTLHYLASRYGPVSGWIAIPGGARLPIRQFIYP